jgi:hypothetical protein
MSFDTVLQQIIYDNLSNDAPLLAVVTGVFDNVPQSTDYPYVVIGEDTLTNWDTDTELGTNCTCVIHTWSRYQGKLETKQIQGLIYESLHRANLTASGYNIVDVQFESSDSFLDVDGLTRHGISNFRVLIEEL